MGGFGNILGLLFEIDADPSKALAAVAETEGAIKQAAASTAAANQQIAESTVAANEQGVASTGRVAKSIADVRKEYEGLADDAGKLKKLPFLSGEEREGLEIDREMMAQLRAEIEALGGTATVTGEKIGAAFSQQASGGIRQTVNELRFFRGALTATLGFAALGFYITEWGRIKDAIDSAIQSLAGYDAFMKAVEQDARHATTEAILAFGKLDYQTSRSLAQISDQHERSRKNLEDQIELTRTQRDEVQSWVNDIDALSAAQKRFNDLNSKMAGEGGFGGGAPTAEQVAEKAALEKQIQGLQDVLGDKVLKDTGKAYGEFKQDVDKANLALEHFQNQLDELNEKPPKTLKAHADAFTQLDQELKASTADIRAQVQDLLDGELPAREQIIAQTRRQIDALDLERTHVRQLLAEKKISKQEESQLETDIDNKIAALRQELDVKLAQFDADRLAKVKEAHAKLEAEEVRFWNEQEKLIAEANRKQDVAIVKAANDRAKAQTQAIIQAQRAAVRATLEAAREQEQAWSELSAQVRTSLSEMSGEIHGWGGVTARVMDQTYNQVLRQIAIERQHAIEQKTASLSGAAATIDALKQLAPVKAVEAAAKGMEALGDFNFWSAAQYFGSAALWGSVSAMEVMSMVGGIGGGGAGKYAGAAGGGRVSGRGSGSDESANFASEGGATQGMSGNVLAPGSAGGAPGRGGTALVLVTMASEDQEQAWVASRVNGAVANGRMVRATVAQRSAPVGH